MSIAGFMTEDHRSCDGDLALVEQLVEAEKWAEALEVWQRFDATTRCHFQREEEFLFPAFEAAMGSTQGPTQVMRMEHEQVRAILPVLEASVREQDATRFLGMSDTLMVLIQQHNMKEEQILYPMSEQVIPDTEAVLAQIRALKCEVQ